MAYHYEMARFQFTATLLFKCSISVSEGFPWIKKMLELLLALTNLPVGQIN